MGIDVLNHMWVGVFSAHYSAQIHQRMLEGRGAADDDRARAFADEAASVADQALLAYQANCRADSERAKKGSR